MPLKTQIFSGPKSVMVQHFTAAADVPTDVTEVDCCTDERPPDVTVLAEVDGGTACYFLLQDMSHEITTVLCDSGFCVVQSGVS